MLVELDDAVDVDLARRVVAERLAVRGEVERVEGRLLAQPLEELPLDLGLRDEPRERAAVARVDVRDERGGVVAELALGDEFSWGQSARVSRPQVGCQSAQWRGAGGATRTVVDALGDRLEDLEVDKGRAAVVAVVLVLVVAGDAVGALEGGVGEGRLAGDARDDGLGVEGEDGGVDVDPVQVEDWRVREGLEDRGRELGRVRERVLVRTVGVGAWSGVDTDTEGMLVLSSVVLFPCFLQGRMQTG